MELTKGKWLPCHVCEGIDGLKVERDAEDRMSRGDVAVNSEVTYEWHGGGREAGIVAPGAFR